MVGYGPEDNHFVIELTYNYGIGSYRMGNDFMVSTFTKSLVTNYKCSLRFAILLKTALKN